MVLRLLARSVVSDQVGDNRISALSHSQLSFIMFMFNVLTLYTTTKNYNSWLSSWNLLKRCRIIKLLAMRFLATITKFKPCCQPTLMWNFSFAQLRISKILPISYAIMLAIASCFQRLMLKTTQLQLYAGIYIYYNSYRSGQV